MSTCYQIVKKKSSAVLEISKPERVDESDIAGKTVKRYDGSYVTSGKPTKVVQQNCKPC